MQTAFSEVEVARFENETWSRCAKGYMDGFGQLVAEAVGPLLTEASVGEGKRVLDVGTGPGLVAAKAAKIGAQVTGVDFSDNMMSEARRLHPEIDFQNASAEDLPFSDSEFDAVVGNFVLHHSAVPDKVLKESFRVLKPGGRIAFTVWADLSKLEAFGLFFAAVEKHAGAADLPHGPLFGVSDFEVFHTMARGVGFEDSSVRELDIVWKTDSIDSLLAAFHDWAALESFPAEIQLAVETTVRENAAAYRREDEFEIPNPAILISATKK